MPIYILKPNLQSSAIISDCYLMLIRESRCLKFLKDSLINSKFAENLSDLELLDGNDFFFFYEIEKI